MGQRNSCDFMRIIVGSFQHTCVPVLGSVWPELEGGMLLFIHSGFASAILFSGASCEYMEYCSLLAITYFSTRCLQAARFLSNDWLSELCPFRKQHGSLPRPEKK